MESRISSRFTVSFVLVFIVIKSKFLSIILGIASPNKRPTLFDVFRRKGSDGKKEKEAVKAIATSDRESNSSAGSGGIMNSMKAAIMSGKSAEAPEPSSKKAVKDGSAHPHAGSDARVRNFNFKFFSMQWLKTCYISVLSHSNGCSPSRCFKVTDAQSNGSLQTSLKLCSFRSW